MTTLAAIFSSRTLPALNSIRWVEQREGKLNHTVLSAREKVRYYAVQIFHFLKELFIWPFQAVYRFFHSAAPLPPPPSSTRLPPLSTPVEFADILPKRFGFAGSMFQDAGEGCDFAPREEGRKGSNQWNANLTSRHIDGVPTNPEEATQYFKQFFVNILDYPEDFADILHRMGTTAYRFSFEWSTIQETPEGPYNIATIDKYKRFIKALQDRNIEPFITLHHFTHPQWFQDLGAFKEEANLRHYINYALAMMQQFPEVKYWYTFNEIGALTLECLLGDHPSSIQSLDDAGQMIRNMLIAHCKTYQEAKKRVKTNIGLTHQWLKFYGINQNPLENLVCDITMKIAHTAIYKFFKTGEFNFQIPGFRSNLRFTVSKEDLTSNHRFLDHIGLQFYGPAHIILGSNGGKSYPGHRIHNFSLKKLGIGVSFGGTCPEGMSVMSFGPTVDPESLTKNLKQACKLECPIHISELGCDAKTFRFDMSTFEINDAEQTRVLQRYAPIIYPFRDQISALFIWTLQTSRKMDEQGKLRPAQLEWNRGAESALGVCEFEKDSQNRITGYSLTSTGEFLQRTFLRVQA